MKNLHLPFQVLSPFNRMLKSKICFVLLLLVTASHVQAQFSSVVKLNSVPSISAATAEKPRQKFGNIPENIGLSLLMKAVHTSGV